MSRRSFIASVIALLFGVKSAPKFHQGQIANARVYPYCIPFDGTDDFVELETH